MRIDFRICSLLFVVAFASCSSGKSGSENNVSEPEEYEIVERQSIDLAGFFEQEEEDYLVFCHADTCAQCHEIIGDVARFAEDNLVKTYFLNVSEPNNAITKVSVDEVTVGVSSLTDLVYAGTPTTFEVVNKTTIANVPGKDKCLTYLNEIRKNNEK